MRDIQMQRSYPDAGVSLSCRLRSVSSLFRGRIKFANAARVAGAGIDLCASRVLHFLAATTVAKTRGRLLFDF